MPRSRSVLNARDAHTGAEVDRHIDADTHTLVEGIRWPSHGSGQVSEGVGKINCSHKQGCRLPSKARPELKSLSVCLFTPAELVNGLGISSLQMHSSHATPDKCLRFANRGRDWILSLLDERGAICDDGWNGSMWSSFSASWKHRQQVWDIACRPKPSGNTLAARERVPLTALEITNVNYHSMHGTEVTRTTDRTRLARKDPTPGAFSTCTATFTNGARTGTALMRACSW